MTGTILRTDPEDGMIEDLKGTDQGQVQGRKGTGHCPDPGIEGTDQCLQGTEGGSGDREMLLLCF